MRTEPTAGLPTYLPFFSSILTFNPQSALSLPTYIVVFSQAQVGNILHGKLISWGWDILKQCCRLTRETSNCNNTASLRWFATQPHQGS